MVFLRTLVMVMGNKNTTNYFLQLSVAVQWGNAASVLGTTGYLPDSETLIPYFNCMHVYVIRT